MKQCEVEGCERDSLCRDLCSAHYARRRRLGNVLPDQPVRAFDLSDTPTIEKKRARGREWYERNADAKCLTNRTKRNETYIRLQKIKLASGCMDCPKGTVWPSECLDFDHVRGEKKFNLAAVGAHTWSTVQAEIAKCEVVCANHHRIRTSTRRTES